MMDYCVYKIPTSTPGDISGLQELLKTGAIKGQDIKAIMNMTEGDGYARGYSSLAYSMLLAPELKCAVDEVPHKIPLIMIGGCSGLVSPYAAVFVRREAPKAVKHAAKRFAFGVALTKDFLPEEQGTMIQVEAVSKAVRQAMEEAEITQIDDIHCVQVKGPWLTPAQIEDAATRGKKVVSTNIDVAGGCSRGASALGVSMALGEHNGGQIEKALMKDFSVNSKIASASSGNERVNCAVIVMGNSKSSASKYTIGHAVMKDGADSEGVKDALRSAGMSFDCCVSGAIQKKINHVFVKSAVDGTGRCRGRRHVLTSDFLGAYSWLIGKAVIHAIVTSVVGDPMMQVSGGFEHQGPVGGGLVAAIIEAE